MKSSKGKKKALVPRLRFPEFEGDGEWGGTQLSEIMIESKVKGSKGNTAKKITVKLWGRGVFEKNNIGSENTQYYKRRAGQFIYSKLDFLNQAFGLVSENLDGYETTVDLPCFDILGGHNPTFLLELIMRESCYKKIGEIADGSRKAKRIHADTFLSFSVELPSIPEQQKIADCLSSLDDLITAETERYTALQDHKKGLMQQLFPAESKTTPKCRFPEFEGDWHEEGFEQVFKPIASKRFQIQNSQIQNRGTYEVIDQGKDNIAGYSDEFEKLFKNVPVIVFGDHTTILKLIKTPFIVGADGTKLLTNRRRKDNLEYLYYFLISKNIKQDGYKRHFSVLKKIVPYLASPAEQQKIADCLTSLDNLIAAQSDKIETLKDHKKGLLQQLFPPHD